MARLYEYQGKTILMAAGIATPAGKCASTAEAARQIAQEIGRPVAIKAQVWATGRFQAGGIAFASTPEEAAAAARRILGSTIKGLPVHIVLVEERLDVVEEFYAGIIVNASHKVKGPVLMFSTVGGTGIEEVAAKQPDRVGTLTVDYLSGITPADAERLIAGVASDSPLSGAVHAQLSDAVCKLYAAFKANDARAAEINPLVLTRDGQLCAADCRITIDDNSVFRHPGLGITLPRDMERPPTPLEEIAWSIEADDYRGTGYFSQMVPTIEGRGWLGFHGIGGGGAMLGASAFVTRGFKIANYADTSGDPTASKIYRVIKCILSQPVDGYVLMGAVLANQEQWHHAHAVVKALREEAANRLGFPVILLIAGNKERESHEIIREGLKGLPLRWELYGREHIYHTDFIADRVLELTTQYQREKYGAEDGSHA
ncbi:MAG: acetate--CoA ligase family protein [Chloroflexi bacterium]|nr:acetate--CoA ligase family protein [Chloroflexota bacterium]